MRSLYIHIPFCKHKCYYCDFNSYAGKEELVKEYVEALKKELSKVISYNGSNCFYSVYFGGGTPSFISPEYIEEIMSLINCDGEVTLEVNPGTVNKDILMKYKEIGINRLSIGLQATQDEILKRIGRIHTLLGFDNVYKDARAVGFKNISVDLMFCLPRQTIEDVQESLEHIIKINPEHVSCYSLILHDDLVNKRKELFSAIPSEEIERSMYYTICDKLQKAGYDFYEISNFAKPSFYSKHNLCYWNQEEYFGIGAGASSYINSMRYKNVDSLEDYIHNVEQNYNKEDNYPYIDSASIVEEVQTKESKLNEYMILKLRLIEGIKISEVNEKFNIDVLDWFKDDIKSLTDDGLLEISNCNGKPNFIRLSKKGLDLANLVWERFV